MLRRSGAPDQRSVEMVGILDEWRRSGASRVDADGDGRIDSAGAPIIDAAWRGIAGAGLCGRLGRALCEQLETDLISRFDAPPGGQYGGWHQYLFKDLRKLLGRPVRAPYSVGYCGRGRARRCARRLWAAISAAGERLAQRQGSDDPAAWSAPVAQITFSPLDLVPMQYTNRPSGIHQVMTFGG